MSVPQRPARVGISTYALFWEISERNPNPLSPQEMVTRAADLGCNVLQICDQAWVGEMTLGDLSALGSTAAKEGVAIELGTRGVDPSHLEDYLHRCESVGAAVLRSMVPADTPGGLNAVEQTLTGLTPHLERADVDLALETYEQLPTADLVGLVNRVGHPRVGIALDPANCVARLENPDQVIDACGPRTLNLHVKDFSFSRQDGWVGFLYAGAPMGEGLLDYAHEVCTVRPRQRAISQIVEHWLPWRGDIKTTIDEERRWTQQALNYIKENQE